MPGHAHQSQQSKISKQGKEGGDEVFKSGDTPERGGGHDGDQQALSTDRADPAHAGGHRVKAGKPGAEHASEQQQGIDNTQNRMNGRGKGEHGQAGGLDQR